MATTLTNNNIARLLTNAFLECFLIVCLLINGSFFYLLSKFAAAVGLAPPCMFCTRLDNLFEPPENKDHRCRDTCRDFLCDRHVNEVIKSGFYYLNDESEDGDDGSIEGKCDRNRRKLPKREAVFPEESLVVEQVELVSRNVVDRETELVEVENEGVVCVESSGEVTIYEFGDFVCCMSDDGYVKGLMRGEEFYDVDRLVPVELIDEVTVKNSNLCCGVICREYEPEIASVSAYEDFESNGKEFDAAEMGDNGEDCKFMLGKLGRLLGSIHEEEALLPFVVEKAENVCENYPTGVAEDDDMSLHTRCACKEESVLDSISGTTIYVELKCYGDDRMDLAKEESIELASEIVQMNDISLEIPSEKQQSVTLDMEIVSNEEDAFIATANGKDTDEEEVLAAAEQYEDVLTYCEPNLSQSASMLRNGSTVTLVEAFQDVRPEDTEKDSILCNGEVMCKILMNSLIYERENFAHIQSDESFATSQAEHDKLPRRSNGSDIVASYVQTPENLNAFQDIFEIEEESLKGSVASDVKGSELSSMGQLKSALQAEHKALNALYAELEEERNASAIAANHAMAMITRLQEEKATMQMEALQYQRMMEEQSEYDQQLLHHLNELLIEREKEKQELEDELEAYKKKYLQYKAYEKRMEDKANGFTETSIGSSSSEDNFSL